jgi:hypothetical protein
MTRTSCQACPRFNKEKNENKIFLSEPLNRAKPEGLFMVFGVKAQI